ncbi:MAG: serine/threonine-protein kinase, partial [Verrucomicrobiota bacterium]
MSAPTSDPSKKAPRSRTKDSVLGQSLRKIDPGQLVFRRFHLERELGEGAMGVVWLARDERDNDQRVALKFLSDFITGHEAALTGLQREVRRARTLSHPGIVTVYDFHANHAEHLSTISMEWIDGPSVADIHGEQPDRCFEPEELVSWLHQLCNALTYLHGKAGIVHGRIKPGNIMIGEHGHLKLADTGFGDDLEDNHDERPSCALPYMSPQQVKKEPAHPSDDIYAIGATFYELLAGTPPFHRGPPKSILFQIENDEPQSINERRQQQRIVGRPPIPPEWETLLADCLAKHCSRFRATKA